MSKKKKRHRRKRGALYFLQKDFHHFFYTRAHWSVNLVAWELRRHPYCGGYVEKYTTHRAIHEAVVDVPIPPVDAMLFVMSQLDYYYGKGWISDKDDPKRKLDVLAGLFEKQYKPTADALRLQLEAMKSN